MTGRVIFYILGIKKGEIVVNRNKIRDFVGKTILINSFNLGEYQDKYYFQKKLKEEIPEFSEQEIYAAIEKYFKTNKESTGKLIIELSDELYNLYLEKGK